MSGFGKICTSDTSNCTEIDAERIAVRPAELA